MATSICLFCDRDQHGSQGSADEGPTYRGDFAIGEGRVDAIQLELGIDVLLLDLEVGGDVD